MTNRQGSVYMDARIHFGALIVLQHVMKAAKADSVTAQRGGAWMVVNEVTGVALAAPRVLTGEVTRIAMEPVVSVELDVNLDMKGSVAYQVSKKKN